MKVVTTTLPINYSPLLIATGERGLVKIVNSSSSQLWIGGEDLLTAPLTNMGMDAVTYTIEAGQSLDIYLEKGEKIYASNPSSSSTIRVKAVYLSSK